MEVDPGHGKTLPAGGRIALSDTLPDVNLDEVLAVLDGDTRPYLQLLINGGGKGLEGRGERPVQDAAPARPAPARHAPGLGRPGQAPGQPAPADQPLRPPDRGGRRQRPRPGAAGAGQQPGVLRVRRRARQPVQRGRAAARHAAPDPDHAERRARLQRPARARAPGAAPDRAPAGPGHPRAAPAGARGHADRARPAAPAGARRAGAAEHPGRRGRATWPPPGPT